VLHLRRRLEEVRFDVVQGVCQCIHIPLTFVLKLRK
jgi:hypothetical protein